MDGDLVKVFEIEKDSPREDKDIISKFSPSKMDSEIYAACPYYIEDSRVVPSVYSQMQDMFRNYILICLKTN